MGGADLNFAHAESIVFAVHFCGRQCAFYVCCSSQVRSVMVRQKINMNLDVGKYNCIVVAGRSREQTVVKRQVGAIEKRLYSHIGTVPVLFALPKQLLRGSSPIGTTLLVPLIPAAPASPITPAMYFIVVRRWGLAFTVARLSPLQDSIRVSRACHSSQLRAKSLTMCELERSLCVLFSAY